MEKCAKKGKAPVKNMSSIQPETSNSFFPLVDISMVEPKTNEEMLASKKMGMSYNFGRKWNGRNHFRDTKFPHYLNHSSFPLPRWNERGNRPTILGYSRRIVKIHRR